MVIHRHKGTISALRRAIEPLGTSFVCLSGGSSAENREHLPLSGHAGQWRDGGNVSGNGAVVADARPVSRHMTGLNIIQEIREIFSRRQQLTTVKSLPFIRRLSMSTTTRKFKTVITDTGAKN